MTPLRIFAVVLLLAGIAALVWGGFSFTRERHEAEIGPIELSVEERETVDIPVWAGIGAIVLGAVLLFSSRRASG